MKSDSATKKFAPADLSPGDVRVLFHQLNNQLGIILAHAEVLEAKSPDDTQRARARHVITGVFEALGAAHAIRSHLQEFDRQPDAAASLG